MKLDQHSFLAENVPGILDSQYDEIRKNAISQLDLNVYTVLALITITNELVRCAYYANTNFLYWI